MIAIVLSCWSCLLIFLWMIRTKFYWTRPHFRLWLFVAAGAAATIPALACNAFLGRNTELWPFASQLKFAFGGFLISAGISEEFWKFLFALFALLCYRRSAPNNAERTLGFILTALTFAAVENFISYRGMGAEVILLRGVLTVPLHAVTGLIYGLSATSAIRRSAAWPLLFGYLVAVILHTVADTWTLFLPPQLARHVSPVVPLLGAVWFTWVWRRLPEFAFQNVYSEPR